jgi:hypothetical protein
VSPRRQRLPAKVDLRDLVLVVLLGIGSASKVAAGHAFKDADKRRLFGEHLVLAGLPE